MTANRISAFQSLDEQDNPSLDSLADFKPSASSGRPTKDAVKEITSFPSREPQTDGSRSADRAHSVHIPEPKRREPRLFKTGRNSTITIRGSAATIERFYVVADRMGLKNAETFERAVEVLEKMLDLPKPTTTDLK